MAADKKILLRDALKQVQAGKIDKAIETYKSVVKVDPRDPNVHNNLGDLYVRQGRKKEAIVEYLEASDLFEKDNFALRSIAICQKVINLDNEQWSVRLKLADLSAGQKLAAEARAQYLLIADRHDKRGEVAAALEIFSKLANLEPDNLQVRVKLAARFEKKKMFDKAAEEYARAAKGYFEKKETETALQLYARAFKLSPGNPEARPRLAEFYAQRQDWPVVVGLLETPVRQGTRETALIVLYAEALIRVEHAPEAIAVLQKAQEYEPNAVPVNLLLGRAYLKAGDTEKGIAAMNRCVNAHLAENHLDLADLLLREMAAAVPGDDNILQRLLEIAQKRGDPGAVGQAYLKLADLYQRKGLVRSAVGSLEKYLEVNPRDEAVARRARDLKSQTAPPQVQAPPPPIEDEVVEIDLEENDLAALLQTGDEEITVEIEGEEEPASPAEIEPTSVAAARAGIDRGQPEKAAAFLEQHLGAQPDDVEAWEALIEARRRLGNRTDVRDALLRLADVYRRSRRFEEARVAYKGALDIDHRSSAAARGLADLLLEEEQAAAPAVSGSEEISLDFLDEADQAPPQPVMVEFPPEVPPEVMPEVVPEFEPEFEPEAVPEVVPEFEPEFEPEVVPEVKPEPEVAPELESFADFLDISLDQVPPPPAPAVAEPVSPVFQADAEEVSLEGFGEDFSDLALAEEIPIVAEKIAIPETGTGTGELEEFLSEADFYLQQGLLDEAEFLYTKLLRLSPGDPEITGKLRRIEELRRPESAPPPPEAPPAAPVAAAALAAAADFSDFLSSMHLENEFPGAAASPLPEEDGGLTGIFQEFQRSVKEQLGDQDFETHYNLGIAYKEMGLLQEALGEFTLSEKSPVRQMDSVSMIALCLRDMGRFDDAERTLRNGLSLAVEGSEEQKGFLYDIAGLHEQAGRLVEAQETLRQLLALDPRYRDVAARVQAAPPPPAPPAPGPPQPEAAAPRKKSKVSYL